MGIDAKILVRYRGDKPTDKQLATWSWDLCRTVGAEHFFISDGLPSEEYEKANKQWHKEFNNHPLYSEWKKNRDREVHSRILNDISKVPKELRRAIDLTCRNYTAEDFNDYREDEVPDTHLAPGKVYFQDGPCILAGAGEILLSVSLWSGYYGPGYERGDIITICAIAEWIEQNMQPCEVWYGGDSSGVLAKPFTVNTRCALKQHLNSQTGREYFSSFNDGKEFPTPEPCGMCIPDENRFIRCGWGHNFILVNCAGCGKSFESNDNGETWAERKE